MDSIALAQPAESVSQSNLGLMSLAHRSRLTRDMGSETSCILLRGSKTWRHGDRGLGHKRLFAPLRHILDASRLFSRTVRYEDVMLRMAAAFLSA